MSSLLYFYFPPSIFNSPLQSPVSVSKTSFLASSSSSSPPVSLSPSASQASQYGSLYGDGSFVNSPEFCTACKFLRGAVAGSIAKTITYPFDRLKMIWQVRSPVAGTHLLCRGSFHVGDILRGISEVIRQEGFLALWKGNMTSFTRTFAHSGIVFFTYEEFTDMLQKRFSTTTCSSATNSIQQPPQRTKHHTKEDEERCPLDSEDCGLISRRYSSALCTVLAGGLAGMTSTCLTYPLDVWNTRMAVSQRASKYTQVMLLRYEGWASLYRGLTPTLIGIFPYAGISFFTFELLKDRVISYRSSGAVNRTQVNWSERRLEQIGPVSSLFCGGFAGVISQTATYPIDTVRKFMQANTFLYKFKVMWIYVEFYTYM
eukprot:GHVQ01019010.1.p1 GENE.GHVQ01019010.1~~GHVQ01019010.1.p1  ORF type:complete len:372 (+),score=16.07 GHVQ01019010.1:450-1565(+)